MKMLKLACISRRKNGNFKPKQPIDIAVTSQMEGMSAKESGACRRRTPCGGRPAEQQRRSGSFSSGESGRLRWPSVLKTSIFRSTAGRKDDLDHEMQEIYCGECNKRPSSADGRQEKQAVFVEEKESVEWVAQAERGVLITLISLPDGGNDLIRIRFSREMFDDKKAQKWWMENREKIMELYNVKTNTTKREVAFPLPTTDQNPEEDHSYMSSSAMKFIRPNSHEPPPPPPPPHPHRSNHGPMAAICDSLNHPPMHAETKFNAHHHARSDHVLSSAKNPRILSRAAAAGSCCRELESEWVEQDEPGVYITLRASAGGRREIRRIQFRLEEVKEKQARQWWKENRQRITKQYLHM